MKIEEGTFVVVDFETVTPTGRSPEPMELASMCVKPKLIIDSKNIFNHLMHLPSGVYLSYFDTRQTGITQNDLNNAISQESVFNKFSDYLPKGNFVFIAQNANYESNIFNRFSKLNSIFGNSYFIDTIKIAKYLYPLLNDYKLDTISAKLSIPISYNRHRALPDVEMTIKVFVELIKKGIKEKKFTTIADLIRIASVKRSINDNTPSLF
jgi:DNA polymerase III subunit epsilon